MFEDIPQRVWQYSPEFNVSRIPCVPRIPFSVLVFPVLYIALILLFNLKSLFFQNIVVYILSNQLHM